MNDINNINTLVLAYLGDSYFDLYIKEMLIKNNIAKIDELQNQCIEYVSAKGQVKFLNYLIENNILNEKELSIVKKGRNYKRNAHPKNTDILTYKHSTGFETLIGYLYLFDKNRLSEILLLVKEI